MKPADSGQIAKVREFWNEWVNGPDGGESLFLTSSNQSRTVFKFAAAFAESERQAVIEDCAKVADRLSKNQTNIKHPQQRMTVEATAESIAAAIRSME